MNNNSLYEVYKYSQITLANKGLYYRYKCGILLLILFLWYSFHCNNDMILTCAQDNIDIAPHSCHH